MAPHLKRTEAVKQCTSCTAHLPASDNFCRRCGIRQTDRAITAARPVRSECDTIGLSNFADTNQTLSSLLVNRLMHSVAVKTAPLTCGRMGTWLVAALVSIPIWLLIILLSPLDAYAAARAASGQLSAE